MTFKVVFNACFGGFGLSDAAIKRYAEIKGLTLYPETSKYCALTGPTYYTVPPEKRRRELTDDEFHAMPKPERKAHNALPSEILYAHDIPRDDPALIQVVEELGKAANDKYANLQIAELPDDVLGRWHIDEYDGNEHVAEDHRIWS